MGRYEKMSAKTIEGQYKGSRYEVIFVSNTPKWVEY